MAKEYSNGVATVKLTAWDQNEKAYVFTNDRGDTFFARKGSKIPKDFKFNYKDSYKVEIGKEKNVGNVWYVNSVTNLTGLATQSPSKSASGNGYDSVGQERGNYRTNVTALINAFMTKNGGLPNEEVITAYNKLLKFGETQLLNKQTVEENKPTGVVKASEPVTIPEEGNGVLSATPVATTPPTETRVNENVPF